MSENRNERWIIERSREESIEEIRRFAFSRVLFNRALFDVLHSVHGDRCAILSSAEQLGVQRLEYE